MARNVANAAIYCMVSPMPEWPSKTIRSGCGAKVGVIVELFLKVCPLTYSVLDCVYCDLVQLTRFRLCEQFQIFSATNQL